MLGAATEYARANQACIMSPFILAGAMSPVIAGLAAQSLAEALSGMAYTQLVRPGAPVIFGTFASSMSMATGAPTFGTPEGGQAISVMAALARRVGTPFRSGGQFTASKYPDAQAAYESSSTIIPTVLSGVNFVLHAAGWQEGGLALGFEKLILDADQLGFMDVYARGIDISENGQAMEAFRTNRTASTSSATATRCRTSRRRLPLDRGRQQQLRAVDRRGHSPRRSGPTRPGSACSPSTPARASTRRSTPNSRTSSADARRRCPTPTTRSGHDGNASLETIGFIGLGNMGLPMCLNLVDAGYDVVALDLRPEPVAEVVAAGGRTADDVAAVAAEADILLTSLPRPDHVDGVMRAGGALTALRPGSVWADLTTNRREFVQELADEAPDGVTVMDSPVTGAVDGARNKRLTLFAGGAESDLDRVVPVLENLGRVIRCGPLGTGNVVKLVTNQLWFIHAASIGEGFALGMANGVELPVLYDAICDSVGDSFVARHDGPSIFAGHYDPSFTLDLCLKDLGLVRELESSLEEPLVMTAAAHGVFEDAAERYGRNVGELHVAKRLEDDNQLSFRMDGDWVAPWDVTDD